MASYNNFESSYAGIINALAEVRLKAGEQQKSYPASYQGIIEAIQAMDKSWSGVSPGEYPPGWIPIYDEDGNVIGGNWAPGFTPAQGNLWFDERQGRLMVYVDDAYYQTNGADVLTKVQNTQPEPDVPGALWYNPDTDDLYLWDGTAWILVSSQTVNTMTLPLANPTSDTTGARALPSTDNLSTQADFNAWVFSALDALDKNPGGNAEVFVSASSPVDPNEGDLWYTTNTLELLVRFDSFWVPSAIPLTSDPNFVGLASEVNITKSTLEAKINSAVSRVEALEDEDHKVYSLSVTGAPGIKLTDEGGDSDTISFQAGAGLTVTRTDSSITYSASGLQNQINLINGNYTPKADTTAISSRTSTLESKVSTLENTPHVAVSAFDSLADAVSLLPSQGEVDAKLSLAGGDMTGQINMGNNRISGLSAALHPSDAVRNAEFAAYQASAASSYMAKDSTIFPCVDVQRDDISIPGIKLVNGAAAGRRAIEINTNRATNAVAVFGQTDHAGEMAWEFNGGENFSWIDGTTGKQLRIDAAGVIAKNLSIGSFIRSGNGQEQIMNKIDVKERLEAYQTAFTGLRSALNSSSDFDEFKQSALIALAGL